MPANLTNMGMTHALSPTAWARDVLDFRPDKKQSLVLRSPANRLLLNCTRQWGKSTTTAAKALHRALTAPGQLIIALSPSARQTGELMRKIETFAKKSGIDPRGDGDNEMSILFSNSSRIVGLPGTDGTIRGFSSVKLLIIDEASRVSEASYKAARPMLAVGLGDLICLSTPYGKRGFFYEEWAHGGSSWDRFECPAKDCARISPKFLAEERASLGDIWYRQEYCCEFVDTQDQLFSNELVEGAMDDELEPIFAF